MELDEMRHALSIGQKVGSLTVINHPTSGDRYAVITSDAGILWAAGPLGVDDDPQAFIDNQFSGDMVDDAEWLQAEINAHS